MRIKSLIVWILNSIRIGTSFEITDFKIGTDLEHMYFVLIEFLTLKITYVPTY